jgi:NADH-quinone oxidoreductase subunit G
MDTMAEDPVLNVSERGDRAVIGKFEGHDLTHPWAGNVIDLCPVGALLSKDSLNKVRAWEVDRTASVCPNCTQGCNMIIETRDNMVVRLRPRPNEAVNRYFMCDYGRLNYRWINRQDRAEMPLVRRGTELVAADWETALAAAANALKNGKARVVASPMLSNEALGLLARLVKKTGGSGTFSVAKGERAPLPGVENLARREDLGANVRGLELFGFTRSDRPAWNLGDGDVLVVAGSEFVGIDSSALGNPRAIIVIGGAVPSWASNASVVLPIASFAEEEGTFTNVDGRVQRFMQSRAAPGYSRPSFTVLSDLLALLGESTNYMLASDAFAAIASSEPAFSGMSYDTLGLRGAPVAGGAGR